MGITSFFPPYGANLYSRVGIAYDFNVGYKQVISAAVPTVNYRVKIYLVGWEKLMILMLDISK